MVALEPGPNMDCGCDGRPSRVDPSGDLSAPCIQLLVGVSNASGTALKNGTVSLKVIIKFWR